MKKRNKLITAAALVLGASAGLYAFTASSEEGPAGFGPMHRMGPQGMMGMGHSMMGAGPNSATMAEMRAIHELFANHDRIKRTVTNLPDGIRTVTESDDPRIAQILKDHVAGMRQRVDAGRDPGLPIESPALHAIFRNKDKLHTTVETTAKGIVVVQTSDDRSTVTFLQTHAAEVSDFVSAGMLALRTAMMRNGGGMMPGGMMQGGMMHGGMMGHMPNGGMPPDAQ